MKKIEAIIDPAALDAIKLHFAEAGIDGRLTVTQVSGLEDLGRFYQRQTNAENPWKSCLRIDLIVSDRQTESAINIILRRANLVGGRATGGHINILSLDATLEISTEEPRQPPKDKNSLQRREGPSKHGPLPEFTFETSKQESVRQGPEESSNNS